MEICLIGCGKMGGALLAGWQQDTSLAARFTVIDPFLTPAEDHPLHHLSGGCV